MLVINTQSKWRLTRAHYDAFAITTQSPRHASVLVAARQQLNFRSVDHHARLCKLWSTCITKVCWLVSSYNWAPRTWIIRGSSQKRTSRGVIFAINQPLKSNFQQMEACCVPSRRAKYTICQSCSSFRMTSSASNTSDCHPENVGVSAE